jgi:murein DD-endopeptidase MepM/ murein hydrolase activator NlpD
MNRNTKSQRFWQGKGFYLALALVVAGAALTSFLAINGMVEQLGTNSTSQHIDGEEDIWMADQGAEVDQKQENVPITSSSSSQPQSASSSSQAPSASSAASSESVTSQAVQEPSFTSPLSGVRLQGFSGDELVYNETMKDWRTHNGLDIRGSENVGIQAPATGTVTAVYEDPQWGGVVEMECQDVMVRMCGLTNIKCKEGDSLEQGKTFAALGEVPAESSEESHLHVEITKDGKLVDPENYF